VPARCWPSSSAGRSRGPWLSWTGPGADRCAALAFDERTAFPGCRRRTAGPRHVLVLLGGAPLGLLVHPVSAYVGRLSYSLYLWHWPVLVLAPRAAGRTRAHRGRPGRRRSCRCSACTSSRTRCGARAG
jgi:peptidoglycan/LPS O-acetylase OafA/YrhL